jgi:hypothetical protein
MQSDFLSTQVLDRLIQIEKHLISNPDPTQISSEWIPKQDLQKFLGYGETKMAALLKESGLVVSTVGNRKFINRKSFLKFLDQNIN